MKFNWLTKTLMKISPRLLFRWAAFDNKLDYAKVEQANKLFSNTKRIDFSPFGGVHGRGLVMYLDNKLSLHFYQDGNTFYYDGFEIGPYENGDVTVFDKCK